MASQKFFYSMVLSSLCVIAPFACSIPSPIAPSLSGSVGQPHSGFLTGAQELAREGKGYRWYSNAHHHFGVPRLVQLIEYAAGQVTYAHPNSPPLFVGELSTRFGGAIFPRHRSHRSGRDVDLLFYMANLKGQPIEGNSFTRFGPDGLGVNSAGQFVRFDIHRNWLLLRSLLHEEIAHVQWIFISRVLQSLLLEHAFALGEPADLIQKAETLMKQPGDSLPHDDHMHVRIACSADELVRGCDGGGPRWPWLPQPPRVKEPSTQALVQAVLDPHKDP